MSTVIERDCVAAICRARAAPLPSGLFEIDRAKLPEDRCNHKQSLRKDLETTGNGRLRRGVTAARRGVDACPAVQVVAIAHVRP